MACLNILATGRAFPKTSLSNRDLENMVDTSDEWIRSRTGICSRFVSREESTADLAVQAVSSMFQNLPAGFDRSSVRYLICATVSADDSTPSCACRVQKLLGLDHPMLAFDVNGACSGFLIALQTAWSLLNEGERAVVIGTERISSLLDWNDRNTCVLFGDGAGAMLIEKKPGNNEPRFFSQTIPDERDLLSARKGETLQMKGSGVFRFALQAFDTVYRNLCDQKEGKAFRMPDLIIPHQANRRIIESAAQKLGISMDRFYLNLDHTGNTSAASIPAAFDEALRSGRIHPGDDVLLIGFGAGLSMAGCSFRYRPESDTGYPVCEKKESIEEEELC